MHPFSGDIPGDRRVLALAGDFVDFVDVDDAALGLLHIHIRLLQQPQQDVFHVFAHVARLGEAGGIGYGEGHVEHFGQGLGQQGFAAAGGADEQDVRLVQPRGGLVGFTLAIALPGQPFVVVVDRYREVLLGRVLAHHLAIEEGLDGVGLGHLGQGGRWLGNFLGWGLAAAVLGATAARGWAGLAVDQFLIQDLVAEINALIADVDPWPGNQLAHLFLRLAAERALQVGIEFGHRLGGLAADWAGRIPWVQDRPNPKVRQPSLRVKSERCQSPPDRSSRIQPLLLGKGSSRDRCLRQFSPGVGPCARPSAR